MCTVGAHQAFVINSSAQLRMLAKKCAEHFSEASKQEMLELCMPFVTEPWPVTKLGSRRSEARKAKNLEAMKRPAGAELPFASSCPDPSLAPNKRCALTLPPSNWPGLGVSRRNHRWAGASSINARYVTARSCCEFKRKDIGRFARMRFVRRKGFVDGIVGDLYLHVFVAYGERENLFI